MNSYGVTAGWPDTISFGRNLLLLFLLLVSCVPAQGQHVKGLHHLPGSIVYDIIQDADHLIWMATDAGLVRYDGLTYETFTVSDGLPSNEILNLGLDSEGRIWIMTFSGVPSYFFNETIYTPVNCSILKQLQGESMHTAFFSQGNDVWIAAEDYTLFRVRNMEEVERYNFNNQMGDPPRLLFADSDGQLIMVGRSGIYRLSGSGYAELLRAGNCRPGHIFKDKDEFYIPCDQNWVSFSSGEIFEYDGRTHFHPDPAAYPFTALRTNDGTYVLGSDRGLVFYHPADNEIFEPGKQLSGRFITRLLNDAEGNVWASTLGEGVFLFPAGSWFAQTYRSRDLGINSFTEVAFDFEDNLYAGTTDSRLLRIRPESDSFDLESGSIGVIGSWGGKLIASTHDGIYIDLSGMEESAGKRKISLSVPKSMQEISPDTLLVSSVAGAVLIIRDHVSNSYRTESIYSSRLTSVIHMPGRGYIGGTTRGLYIIKNQKKELLDPKLASAHITRLVLLSSGDAIAATNGSGIWRISENGVKRLFEQDPRLFTVRDVVPGDGELLWLATPYGTMQLDLERGMLQTVGEGNVLRVAVNGDKLAYITSAELTVRRLGPEFSVPASLRMRNPRMFADDLRISIAENVKLPWTTRTIGFELQAPYYRNPSLLQFRYKLQPGDNQWQISQGPGLVFRDLKPGSYNLMIEAFLADESAVSNQASMAFTIRTPFWQQFWFYLMIALGAAVVSTAAYRFHIAGIRVGEQERMALQKRAAELENQALCAMMNPHFIFNVLNSVRAYMADNKTEMADDYLQRFSRLIRLQLEDSYRNSTTLETELSRLNDYIQLEKLRLNVALHYRTELSPEVEEEMADIEIPSMLIQPFIENAVWHGIQPAGRAGVIVTEISFESDNQLRVRVTDNGTGIGEEKVGKDTMHQSLALKLTAQRLSLLEKTSGFPAYYRIGPGSEGGTEVVLVIPLG